MIQFAPESFPGPGLRHPSTLRIFLTLNPCRLDALNCPSTRDNDDETSLFVLRGLGTSHRQVSVKRQRPSVSEGILTGATHQPHPPTSHSSLSARIAWQGTQLQFPVLLDSGSDASFICPSLVKKMGIATVPLASPMRPCALTGTSLKEVQRVTAFQVTMRRRWFSWFSNLHAFHWSWANHDSESTTLKWIGSGVS